MCSCQPLSACSRKNKLVDFFGLRGVSLLSVCPKDASLGAACARKSCGIRLSHKKQERVQTVCLALQDYVLEETSPRLFIPGRTSLRNICPSSLNPQTVCPSALSLWSVCPRVYIGWNEPSVKFFCPCKFLAHSPF